MCRSVVQDSARGVIRSVYLNVTILVANALPSSCATTVLTRLSSVYVETLLTPKLIISLVNNCFFLKLKILLILLHNAYGDYHTK